MSRPVVYIHRLLWCPYDLYMDEENEQLLASFADVVNDGRREEPVSPEDMARRLDGVSGILSMNGSCIDEITPEVLRQVGTVKVATVSHWWEQYNDVVPDWREAGVEVIDASDACNQAVAEWTVGAAIAGLRRFDEFDRQMKSGVEWPVREHVADQLNGSTFGMVALGKVGKWVARYLRVFDCRVLCYDPCLSEQQAAEHGVELADLDTVLSQSDVVSLHAPVLPETTEMIGARELSLIKDGALFLNCARAALLDNDAFRAEMQKKRFRAYLDVYQPEPPPLEDVLRKLDNVVLTPHCAGHTTKMFLRCGRFAIEALKEHFTEHGMLD
jgi:phosphoglycerate dehydrogenase-like enzyme